ncbi:MAG: crosslink repair DNA glycosylase YcaQ family protein [Pseudomonadota bacterium]
MSSITLDDLRRYAVARTLFKPTTLASAIARLGFVQADPIRAPARAQDLTLRHRVLDYRAGDLERSYAKLAIEEDHFVNYGFMPREHAALMHPRRTDRKWDAKTKRQAADILSFVHERGVVHPRELEQHFAHGRVKNYWGGSSNAGTKIMGGLHYRSQLRVARRDNGIRLYEALPESFGTIHELDDTQRAEQLVELLIRKYAPLPAASLTYLVRLLINYGAPHLVSQSQQAMRTAREQLASCSIDGTTWYWPADENPGSARHKVKDEVRLLAPFDPIAWDRRRFALLWDWTYKFEAYTPPAKRQFGYYALPLLWRDQIVGWANVSMDNGQLHADFGYAKSKPREAAFKPALDDELQRMAQFLVPRS